MDEALQSFGKQIERYFCILKLVIIFPELRDDKTPFFKELESELLQNDINTDLVEASFVHLFRKLDQVSKLERCRYVLGKRSSEKL